MANNSISNNPIKRVIFVPFAAQTKTISTAPIKPIVFVNNQGQPVH